MNEMTPTEADRARRLLDRISEAASINTGVKLYYHDAPTIQGLQDLLEAHDKENR